MAENREALVEASSYGLTNAWQRARERLNAVEAWLDPATIRHLETRGVGRGWRCLEVGAGGGSIARWLSERVGPDGRVLALDIDTRFLSAIDASNVEVRQADIRSDALPRGTFDLAHCRLVLMHLAGAERPAALRRIVDSLRPGGWFVAEEMHFPSMAADPSGGADVAELFARLLDAHNQALARGGFDPEYGCRLLGDMEILDLVDVEDDGQARMWCGGSVGAEAWRLTLEQLGPRMLDTGLVSEADLEAGAAMFGDPRFRFMSQVTMTVWGRRPA
jgi:SAM-dependent methyltransferase